MNETPYNTHRPTITARILHGILNHSNVTLEQQSKILKTESLVLEDLLDYTAEIPLNSYMRIFDKLAKASKSETLGLTISNQFGPELIGAAGFIFLSSPDLKTAIEYFSDGILIIQEVTQLIFTNDEFPTLRYVISDENIGPRRQDVEFSIGYTNGLLKRYIGENYRPKEIYFEHSKPITGNAYEHFFNCPVFFEQEMNAIAFDEADLKKGSAKFDETLIPLLKHYIQLLEHNTYSPRSLSENINQLLVHCIEHDITNISYVAGRLGLTQATLRRRLKAENTSFRILLQKKRVALAKRFLLEPNMSILQIAQKVGYSETASFTRAFQKETGQTPSRYRQTL